MHIRRGLKFYVLLDHCNVTSGFGYVTSHVLDSLRIACFDITRVYNNDWLEHIYFTFDFFQT